MPNPPACPKCGKRVDRNPESDQADSIPAGAFELTGGRRVELVWCPHCGTVLGVLDLK